MYKNLINGRLVEGKGKEFTVYNPENGKAIASLNGLNQEQTEEVLNAANDAFKTWSQLSLNEREKYILKFADVIRHTRIRLWNF